MAGTAQNDLLCYKGEAVEFDFTQKLLGTPEDISAWTIVLTAKAKATDAVPKFTASATIVAGPSGTYKVTLTSTQTNIPAGAYAYDIWRTDTGSECVLSIGALVIQQDVRN